MQWRVMQWLRMSSDDAGGERRCRIRPAKRRPSSQPVAPGDAETKPIMKLAAFILPCYIDSEKFTVLGSRYVEQHLDTVNSFPLFPILAFSASIISVSRCIKILSTSCPVSQGNEKSGFSSVHELLLATQPHSQHGNQHLNSWWGAERGHACRAATAGPASKKSKTASPVDSPPKTRRSTRSRC